MSSKLRSTDRNPPPSSQTEDLGSTPCLEGEESLLPHGRARAQFKVTSNGPAGSVDTSVTESSRVDGAVNLLVTRAVLQKAWELVLHLPRHLQLQRCVNLSDIPAGVLLQQHQWDQFPALEGVHAYTTTCFSPLCFQ